MAAPGGGNLFADLATPGGRERIDELLARPGVRIERIVSTGQATPPGEWYDQAGDEWVALLAGRATLAFVDGRRVGLAPGDWLRIPARERHRVEATSADPPCVWLAVHLPPQSDPDPRVRTDPAERQTSPSLE